MRPVADFIRALRDLVAPSACAGCGMPGPAVCAMCAGAMAPLGPVGCARCGHPWPVAVQACPECPAAVAWARQATAYDPLAARVVSALKDHHRQAVGRELARMMSERIARPGPRAVLVPVPLSAGRLAERGFNQAEVIARDLGSCWGMPTTGCLARADDARHQRGASRAARRRQVGGAFMVTGAMPLDAVLVDDVVTTGATLAAAARALRGAGCARVGAVAAARVVAASRPGPMGFAPPPG